MRVTSTAIFALLTGAVMASGKLKDVKCEGKTLENMSKKDITTCANYYDPTAVYPVWDESEDFSCSMCPPRKTLLRLKKKQMSKNPHRSLCKYYIFLIGTRC
ncbi:hypothetical protein LX36DRAFT_397655 [Colletotrichum falcatum]|nr:hypothetical protein LX36DRAFT_397655 [Colletotrichum falcatum]